jgi:hypothetical protein
MITVNLDSEIDQADHGPGVTVTVVKAFNSTWRVTRVTSHSDSLFTDAALATSSAVAASIPIFSALLYLISPWAS